MSDTKIAKKYKFLGEGICRKVYSINEDYVVKVAKIDDGQYQNECFLARKCTRKTNS